MREYIEYLELKKEIINYVKENNLEDDIITANNEALELSKFEGKQYLHSYRYSKIYDLLKEKNINSMRVGLAAVEITNLIENPYEKDIKTIINDYSSIEYSIEY